MKDLKNLENPAEAPADPLPLFGAWLEEAAAREPCDANAMGLATVGADGKPHLRIVLLKGWDERGFVFYTNMNSRKGQALKQNRTAALNFHWKSLNRAIRIEGRTEPVTAAEADAYFATRSRGSRIGAWASQQSQELESRAELQKSVADFEEKFTGEENIPRPAHWSGTRVIPERIEFWHEGEARLHTRLVYLRASDKGEWQRKMLYP
jgi:pyridoxamine 5'-phosphate oxidase